MHASPPQLVGVAAGDSLTVAWQRNTANAPVSAALTRYRRAGSSFVRVWEKQLPLPRLIGMTSDGTSLYAVSAANEDLQGDTAIKSYRPNVLVMTKFDDGGNQLWQKDLNQEAYLGDLRDGEARNAIYSPLIAGTGAVTYGNGKVVVVLASNTVPDPALTSGPRRHQRAQYFVVSQDGAGFEAAAQTAWRHSFDQRILFDGQDFVFMDLADASWYMPGAGIAMRKIKPTAAGASFSGGSEGVYVYARHGDTAGSQNFSFISLGDVQTSTNGYAVLFTSEKTNRSANRNGWTEPVLEPRNLGFVHVKRAFETVMDSQRNGNPVLGNTIFGPSEPTSINITRNVVDSTGAATSFTRFDKPTKTATSTGVVWLTNLPAGVSAERPKLVKVSDDRFIAVWEEWTYNGTQLAYQSTQAMLLNAAGQVQVARTAIAARLNPSGADRAFSTNGSAAWITGSATTGALTVNTLDANLRLTTTALDQLVAPPAAISDRMLAGDVLLPGQKIQSPDGRFTFTYQTDGNLVLYDASSRALWSSRTHGRLAGRTIMQSDGNLVIYGPNNEFVWQSGTTSAGSRLVMQNDGNAVIYRANGTAAWATGTAQPAQAADGLRAGGVLRPNERIQSPNGRYALIYQTDGNLVLYHGAVPLWHSMTYGRSAGQVRMESSGALTIYGAAGDRLWSTNTSAAGSEVVLQDDANLVIYDPARHAVWASHTVR